MTDLREQLARLLYREVRECCECSNGHVEHVPDDEPMGGGIGIHGMIDFTALADEVIKGLGLREEEGAGGGLTRYVTEWQPDV